MRIHYSVGFIFLLLLNHWKLYFHSIRKNCEVLLYYPTIVWEDIKDYVKKAIGDLLHTNIDVRSRRLISEFPVDGVKCISKHQYNCANMTFSEKSIYERFFQQFKH